MNKKIRKTSAFEIILFIFMALYALVLLTLFVWGFLTSFRQHSKIITDPLRVFNTFSLTTNYSNLFKNFYYKLDSYAYDIVSLFINSLAYAVLCSLAQTFCTATVAYVTTKYPSKFSSFIGYIVVLVTILPIVGNLPSMIVLTEGLHLRGTLIGAIIMKFGFVTVYYFIFCAAFKKISWEYAESALIDGASHFRVYFTIMLPLVGTLIGTIFLLNFIGYWNDFDTPYVFLKNYPTLSVALYGLLTNNNVPVDMSSSIPIVLGAAFAVFLPVLLLFILFKNKIIGNLDDGGIKG